MNSIRLMKEGFQEKTQITVGASLLMLFFCSPMFSNKACLVVEKTSLKGQNNMFLKVVISQNYDNDRSTQLQDKKYTLKVLLFFQFSC